MTFESCPLFNELDWLLHGFFGMDASKLDSFGPVFTIPQKHTDVVVTPEDTMPATGVDGIFTDKLNLSIAVRTADCVPLLLACTHTKQIAAVHAGWRGALSQVAVKALEKMCAAGAKPETIRAALGPSIAATSYPVQSDVRDPFMAAQPEMAPHFKPFEDRYCVDVAGIVAQQLRQSGVNQIWQSGVNTFTDPNYASYRRGDRDKRNISVIMRIK